VDALHYLLSYPVFTDIWSPWPDRAWISSPRLIREDGPLTDTEGRLTVKVELADPRYEAMPRRPLGRGLQLLRLRPITQRRVRFPQPSPAEAGAAGRTVGGPATQLQRQLPWSTPLRSQSAARSPVADLHTAHDAHLDWGSATYRACGWARMRIVHLNLGHRDARGRWRIPSARSPWRSRQRRRHGSCAAPGPGWDIMRNCVADPLRNCARPTVNERSRQWQLGAGVGWQVRRQFAQPLLASAR